MNIATAYENNISRSFKKALQELEKAERSGIENLPDATTLFDKALTL